MDISTVMASGNIYKSESIDITWNTKSDDLRYFILETWFYNVYSQCNFSEEINKAIGACIEDIVDNLLLVDLKSLKSRQLHIPNSKLVGNATFYLEKEKRILFKLNVYNKNVTKCLSVTYRLNLDELLGGNLPNNLLVKENYHYMEYELNSGIVHHSVRYKLTQDTLKSTLEKMTDDIKQYLYGDEESTSSEIGNKVQAIASAINKFMVIDKDKQYCFDLKYCKIRKGKKESRYIALISYFNQEFDRVHDLLFIDDSNLARIVEVELMSNYHILKGISKLTEGLIINETIIDKIYILIDNYNRLYPGSKSFKIDLLYKHPGKVGIVMDYNMGRTCSHTLDSDESSHGPIL